MLRQSFFISRHYMSGDEIWGNTILTHFELSLALRETLPTSAGKMRRYDWLPPHIMT
jgi:hypothetical protein